MKTYFNCCLFLLMAGLLSCKDNSRFPGYEQTEKGLYYKIHSAGADGQAIAEGDIVTLQLRYTTEADSVLFDSKTTGQPTRLKVIESKYPGDIMEGFTMLKVGDSASFITSADSFFTKIANVELPAFIPQGSYLKFYVDVEKAQSEEAMMAEREAEMAAQKEQEMQVLSDYIADSGIEVEPKESGLYYIETTPGKGPSPERGQTVKVHYKGTLLNGEVFDSSYDRGEPLEFALGAGQVIRGWDEGIGYMKKGGKATLIIPSELAYGPQSPPGSIIQPYSTLIFEVELIDVK